MKTVILRQLCRSILNFERVMSHLFVTTNLHHLSPTQVARQFPGEELVKRQLNKLVNTGKPNSLLKKQT